VTGLSQREQDPVLGVEPVSVDLLSPDQVRERLSHIRDVPMEATATDLLDSVQLGDQRSINRKSAASRQFSRRPGHHLNHRKQQ
jgi:hypothetical protein